MLVIVGLSVMVGVGNVPVKVGVNVRIGVIDPVGVGVALWVGVRVGVLVAVGMLVGVLDGLVVAPVGLAAIWLVFVGENSIS